MVNKAAILAVGAIGALVYTVLDQQNILPWSNNANKVWWWERIVPTTQTARAIPAIFSMPQPQQAFPSGVIVPPTQITSVSTGNQINGKYR